jgi:hypothetical protein
LKNVFERDPFWEISAVIAEPDDLFGNSLHLPIEPTQSLFPKDRDELMQYDLIILGDLRPSLLSNEQQEWLVDFVSESGGGLMIIDGQRNGWLSDPDSLLQPLLPVERQSEAVGEAASLRPLIRLTPAGSKLAALDIRSSEEEVLQTVWEQLPAMRWAATVAALPGTETLAERVFESGEKTQAEPLYVTRMLGAGRIFYAASDESWRWRYKVADSIHQRFWNQLARWIMRIPFVSESETLSLDAGAMNYRQGQSVEIRCRIRKNRTTPVAGANVQAMVERPGDSPIMVAMTPDPQILGVYRGTANQLPPGDYQVSVSATGVPKELLTLTTSFRVLAAPSIELNEKSMNVTGLQQLAEVSGGRFLFEDELPKLVDELQPFSRGQIIESETLLWQSYYWFVPVIVLLSIEWWLRKSAGLI